MSEHRCEVHDGITRDGSGRWVYFVIAGLPRVPGDDIRCPGCGQTLTVICGERSVVPARHYREPHCRATVATGDSVSRPQAVSALCSYDADMLGTIIARAQRDQAARKELVA